jgi:hypothetical protein
MSTVRGARDENETNETVRTKMRMRTEIRSQECIDARTTRRYNEVNEKTRERERENENARERSKKKCNERKIVSREEK